MRGYCELVNWSLPATIIIKSITILTEVDLKMAYLDSSLESTQVYPSWDSAPRVAYKYWIRIKVTDSDKHTSLLPYRIDYRCKKAFPPFFQG